MAQLYYNEKTYQLAKAYLDRFLAVSGLTAQNAWLAYRIEHELGNENQITYFANKMKSEFPDSEETALLYKMEQQQSEN